MPLFSAAPLPCSRQPECLSRLSPPPWPTGRCIRLLLRGTGCPSHTGQPTHAHHHGPLFAFSLGLNLSLRGLAYSGWHRPLGIGDRSHSRMLTSPLGERSPSGQQPSSRAVSSLPCIPLRVRLGACMLGIRAVSGLLLCARASVKPAQSAEEPFTPAQPVSCDAARPPRHGHRRQSSDILPGGSDDRQGSPSQEHLAPNSALLCVYKRPDQLVAVSQFLGERPQKGDAAFPGLFQAQLRSLRQACKAEGPPKAALLPSRGVRFQVSIF